MKARVLEAQADLFEIGVLSQTAEVVSVSIDQLVASPAGAPVVIVGGLLGAERIGDMRRLSSVLARARVAVVVVPPFADQDLGRHFATPVQRRRQRRAAESVARVVDGATAEVLGTEVKVRSDHFFDTALGAGVLAVDAQGKPVLIRYQATTTAGPVFFSALQLLTYTALSDEGQRQGSLAHLLSWRPTLAPEALESPQLRSSPPETDTLDEGGLVHVALLLAAGGSQTEGQLRSRAQALLGAELSADDVRHALEELGGRGVIDVAGEGPVDREALARFLEQRGMHPYLRELAALLASEETTP